MSSQYMVVDKKILPKCFEKVVDAKNMLQNGIVNNVTDACKACGISRSTFYKYQEYVYDYSIESAGRKMVFSLKLVHKTGALSKLCGELTKLGISVLTISQSLPIAGSASVMLSCDITNINIEEGNLKKTLENLAEVSKVEILSIEN